MGALCSRAGGTASVRPVDPNANLLQDQVIPGEVSPNPNKGPYGNQGGQNPNMGPGYGNQGGYGNNGAANPSGNATLGGSYGNGGIHQAQQMQNQQNQQQQMQNQQQQPVGQFAPTGVVSGGQQQQNQVTKINSHSNNTMTTAASQAEIVRHDQQHNTTNSSSTNAAPCPAGSQKGSVEAASLCALPGELQPSGKPDNVTEASSQHGTDYTGRVETRTPPLTGGGRGSRGKEDISSMANNPLSIQGSVPASKDRTVISVGTHDEEGGREKAVEGDDAGLGGSGLGVIGEAEQGPEGGEEAGNVGPVPLVVDETNPFDNPAVPGKEKEEAAGPDGELAREKSGGTGTAVQGTAGEKSLSAPDAPPPVQAPTPTFDTPHTSFTGRNVEGGSMSNYIGTCAGSMDQNHSQTGASAAGAGSQAGTPCTGTQGGFNTSQLGEDFNALSQKEGSRAQTQVTSLLGSRENGEGGNGSQEGGQEGQDGGGITKSKEAANSAKVAVENILQTAISAVQKQTAEGAAPEGTGPEVTTTAEEASAVRVGSKASELSSGKVARHVISGIYESLEVANDGSPEKTTVTANGPISVQNVDKPPETSDADPEGTESQQMPIQFVLSIAPVASVQAYDASQFGAAGPELHIVPSEESSVTSLGSDMSGEWGVSSLEKKKVDVSVEKPFEGLGSGEQQ